MTHGAKARRAGTLVELLTALALLGLLLPLLLQFLASGFLSAGRLKGADACQYWAQWWFNRFPRNREAKDALGAMPMEESGVRFQGDADEKGRVTLTVQIGNHSLTVTRSF